MQQWGLLQEQTNETKLNYYKENHKQKKNYDNN